MSGRSAFGPADWRRLRTTLGEAGVQAHALGAPVTEYLAFTAGPDAFVLRCLADGPGRWRIHLRSVSAAGEATLTTQRPERVSALVTQAALLVAAQQRQHTTDKGDPQ